MPPDPPSKSSDAQQDLGLNEHPYRNLSYAPGFQAVAILSLLLAMVYDYVNKERKSLYKFF